MVSLEKYWALAFNWLAYGAKHGGHDFKALNQIYDIWSKNIK